MIGMIRGGPERTMRNRCPASRIACVLAMAWLSQARAEEPADTVFRNGRVYTVDAHGSIQQALAVRAGRIVYVGTDLGAQPFVGPGTAVNDLQGRMLMPGLVDGHMHPLAGGTALVKCNLNYERLTVAQVQSKI